MEARVVFGQGVGILTKSLKIIQLSQWGRDRPPKLHVYENQQCVVA